MSKKDVVFFQSISPILEKNLQSLQIICEDLKKELEINYVGPKKTRSPNSVYEIILSHKIALSGKRSVRLIFDNESCHLTFKFHEIHVGFLGSDTYNLNYFNEEILINIKEIIQQWIFSGIKK